MRSRHRAEHEDQHRQAERRGQTVLEKLQPHIIRGETLRSDTRPDHDRDEQARSDELGSCTAQNVWSPHDGVWVGGEFHVSLILTRMG
ncbi:hypothetical protein GCM10027058_08360 [Microbacterium neimengense]